MDRSSLQNRVLVVDDERHIARLLEFVLTKEGYTVKVAHDGASALRLLDEFEPHLVILDLVLPDMPGPTSSQRSVLTRNVRIAR